MTQTQSTPQYNLPTSKSTPHTLLEHLTDILAHPNANTQAWLSSISSQGNSAARSGATIADSVRLAAVAGVAEVVAYKITLAMARADGLGWSPYGVQSLVESIYRQVRKLQQDKIDAGSALLTPTPDQPLAQAEANNG